MEDKTKGKDERIGMWRISERISEKLSVFSRKDRRKYERR